MDDGTSPGKRICGRARGCRHYQPVRSLPVDEVAVDVRLELHEPGHAALVGDRFVERRSREYAHGVPLNRHVEQKALLLDEFTIENLVQPIRHLVRHHVGEKAQPAQIHSEQRHVLVDKGPGRAQERSIARDHHDQVALPPDLFARHDGQSAVGTCVAASVVEDHLPPAAVQHADQTSQCLTHARIAMLGDEPDSLEHGSIQGLCVLGGHTGAGVVRDSADTIMSIPTGASARGFCTVAAPMLA